MPTPLEPAGQDPAAAQPSQADPSPAPQDVPQVQLPVAPAHDAGPLPVRILRRVENGAVITVFAAMALLGMTEVLGRKFLGVGIPGASVYVQHLTMWIGFLGALLATREHKHLGLSTAEMLPEGRFRNAAHFIGSTAGAAVSAVLAYAAWEFVKALQEGSGATLGGGLKEWVSVAVMPVSMALIAARLVFLSSKNWFLRAVCVAVVMGALALGKLPPEVAEKLSWPGTIIILVSLLFGAPIYAAMSGLAMLWFFAADTPVAAVPGETYRLVSSPTLPAIPILTACGYVLAVGGSSERLVRLFRALVGWLPGGMAVMVVVVCALFTTLTGGSGVTILALGGLVYPILIKEKYPENFSLGVVTASGSLGLLFFPSVPVILYAVVSQQPIEKLFVAGFVPGLIMILMVGAYAVFIGMRHKVDRHLVSGKELLTSLNGAKYDLMVPITILVTFGTGLATMVEASSLAFIYAVIMEVFIWKTLSLKKGLPQALVDAGTLVGSVLMVLGMAMGMTSYMVDEGIPDIVIEWVKLHIESRVIFLLTLNALLLVLGSVLEIFSAIVILAPLLAPLGNAYGVDPLHLGIIFLANLELGFLFPPVGLNLFLSSTRFGKPLPQLYKAAFPFLCIMGVSVLIITYVPAISTGVYHWWDGAPVEAPAVVAPAEAPAADAPAAADPTPAPTPAAE